MSLLDKQFEIEVTSLEGRKHTLSFTGDRALSEIAHAKMILPHLANLIATTEAGIDPGAFPVEVFTPASFQTLKDELSRELSDERLLFSTGARVLKEAVELFNTANQ